MLTSAQAVPLGMILHELATNATKHGALSAAGGQVRVSWTLEEGSSGDGQLSLRWEEAGGPETVPPDARGFGTRLIEFAAAQELQGTAELTFAPEGLQADVSFSL